MPHRMRADASFATPSLAPTMASRDDILAQLGAHSSDALAEVLAALRVRDASSDPDDNNGDASDIFPP